MRLSLKKKTKISERNLIKLNEKSKLLSYNQKIYFEENVLMQRAVEKDIVMMRLENASFRRFLLVHSPDAVWMISHKTKNVLRPKNHNGFEYVPRIRSTVADCRRLAYYLPESHTDSSRIRPNIPRSRMRASFEIVGNRRKSPNSKNYKKYKVFKITTKVVEHRSHAD